MFLTFLLLNTIKVGIIIKNKYILHISIENLIDNPSYDGIPPYKYCVKSQFIVTRYFVKNNLKLTASTLINSPTKNPNRGIETPIIELLIIVESVNDKTVNNTNCGSDTIIVSKIYLIKLMFWVVSV